MPFELGTKCTRLSRDLVATCVLLHQLKQIMGADFDEYACQSLGFTRRALWRYLKVGSGCVEAIKVSQAGGLE
ncbi:hypothetical protein [Cupriavidus basilensis]|uniref:hypothetical protein n=1 Tax=Cupriavidus basilensis TaxID=68895 RepID=UPI0039F688B4